MSMVGRMRTLMEIIESAKGGNKPTYDECYYAMLALSALHSFDSHDLFRFIDERHDNGINKFIVEEAFQRSKRAYAVSPKHFVGWENDPENPDYQRFRQLAMKIADKLEKDAE